MKPKPSPARAQTGGSAPPAPVPEPAAARAPVPAASEPIPAAPEDVVDQVRRRYGRIAEGTESGCCGPAPSAGCGGAETSAAVRIGYGEADLSALPEGSNLGLGCGAPVELLDPAPGETVLDLGSGAGVDCFLAARRVGAAGRVIGVDMTPAMLERARANAARDGLTNVDFRAGRLEALPVPDGSVDAVTSNCVINLAPDKGAVFREIARVLRPGGRLVIADIVLDAPLPAAVAGDLLAYVGCVAGALERRPYFDLVAAAGLADLRILKDVDYLAAAGYVLSGALRARLDAARVTDADLKGKVRSITWGARKPAA